jgi:Holliday junction resolvasome RuvABC endonuclease subunit
VKILSFDISTKRTGWAFGDVDFCIEASGSFPSKSYVAAYVKFGELLSLYKPDIVITAKPTNRYNVIRALSEVTGILLYLCEKKGVKVDKSLVDASCKKVVIGHGFAKKEQIMAHYGIADSDEADARMFWDYYKLKLEES